MRTNRRLRVAGVVLLAAGMETGAQAGTAETVPKSEMELLKAQVAAQQQQIDRLRQRLDEQAELLERALRTREDAPATSRPAATAPSNFGPEANGAPLMPKPSPLSLKIGAAHLTPHGFLDFTSVIRDRNVGSNIATNFGAIPFANTVNGNLREYRFSSQNSRLGLRVDARLRGVDLLGYLETDFQGVAPGNIAVTSNSDTQRLRLAWVDVRKGKLEVLAGQSWSMLTPNRKGLSPLPGDIFFTQAVDSNYHVGLTWSRNPQFRVIYHASKSVALGWSIEAAEQYAGGASGSGAITLPSALTPYYSQQLNTGSSLFVVPNPHQENIVKVAFDPKLGDRPAHFEFAGLLSRFAFYNPLSNRHFDAAGGGGAFNFNIELVKNLRLFVNTFHSSGARRWIFGQGPDLIIQGDGSPSLVNSSSTVDGFERRCSTDITGARISGRTAPSIPPADNWSASVTAVLPPITIGCFTRGPSGWRIRSGETPLRRHATDDAVLSPGSPSVVRGAGPAGRRESEHAFPEPPVYAARNRACRAAGSALELAWEE